MARGGRTAGAREVVEGLVVAPTARHAKVEIAGVVERCLYAPALREKNPGDARPVVAGDRVRVRRADRGDLLVEDVLPRSSVLARRLEGGRRRVIVANADRVLVVVSCVEPPFLPRLVDRMLVAAEAASVTPTIVVTKVDLLADRAPLEELISVWTRLGYDVRCVSTVTGEGIDDLRKAITEGLTVAVGQSGVGKSSLLTALEPALRLKTGVVSDKWGRGRHTTTAASLHRFMNGWLCDTPGIRSFGLAGLEPQEVAVRFRDFQPFIDDCRFNSCTHVHEPECAVKAAAARGEIHPARMDSYLRIVGAEPDDVDDDADEGDGD